MVSFSSQGSLTTMKLEQAFRFDLKLLESNDDVLNLRSQRCYQVLGAGSNSIINPEVSHTIYKLGREFNYIKELNGYLVVGGATPLPKIATYAMKLGWSGFEWLISVPGSLGGGISMNAGTSLSSMSNLVVQVKYFDAGHGFQIKKVRSTDFSYRRSIFANFLVTEAVLKPVNKAVTSQSLRQAMKDITLLRSRKFPLNTANCGSVFLRPKDGLGPYAGELIEKSGCKGLTRGGVSVSERHANFFINDGTGSFEDFRNLASDVQYAVYEKLGVALEREVRFIGGSQTDFERLNIQLYD